MLNRAKKVQSRGGSIKQSLKSNQAKEWFHEKHSNFNYVFNCSVDGDAVEDEDLLDDSDTNEDEYEVNKSNPNENPNNGAVAKNKPNSKSKKSKKPIVKNGSNLPLRGSENSLLTDDDLDLLQKGMDEDGSFREGRYAD